MSADEQAGWHNQCNGHDLGQTLGDGEGQGSHSMSVYKLLYINKYWSQQTPSSSSTRDNSTDGHHPMVNTEIGWIIFFVAKDVEALYSQQK